MEITLRSYKLVISNKKVMETREFDIILVMQKLIESERTCCVLLSVTIIVWLMKRNVSPKFQTVTFKLNFLGSGVTRTLLRHRDACF